MFRQPRLRTLVGACVLAGSLALPVGASAAWTSPVNVSTDGADAETPQVGIDGLGAASSVWQRFDGSHERIQMRVRQANARLRATLTISPPGAEADQPQIAVNRTGTAVMVWRLQLPTGLRTQLRTRVNGALTSVVSLSPSGQNTSDPQVAINGNGDAVIAWVNDSTNRVQAVGRTAGGTLSAVHNISLPGAQADSPRVTLDGAGDAQIAWDNLTAGNIQARTMSVSGTLGTAQTVSPAGGDTEVAGDGAGNAVIVWDRLINGFHRVQIRGRSPAGTLSAIQTLSPPGDDGNEPSVAMTAQNSTGEAYVAWHELSAAKVEGRARSSAGVLSTTQVLSNPSLSAAAPNPDVGIDSAGDAVAVWEQSDGTNVDILARTRTASGTLSSIQPVSSTSNTTNSNAQQVAVNNSGKAVAVWTWFNSNFNLIQLGAEQIP